MHVTSVNAKTSARSAIADAARKTGVDFHYLLGQAQVESGLRADARAATSSATGLYQFIEQSWLGVLKEHGAEHGLGWAADSIRQTAGGRYVVDDAGTRQAILDLRRDPQTAAIMAAEHAADNKAALEQSLDRPATGTDLYMAHFLGLGGARSFLGAMADDPGQSGAAMFPAAARANRSIFYAANGQPRSLGEIYTRFAGKLDSGAATAAGGLEDGLEAMDLGDTEVVLGTGAVGGDRHWVQTTLAQLGAGRATGAATVNPLRPTPETARIAYLMLANLGA